MTGKKRTRSEAEDKEKSDEDEEAEAEEESQIITPPSKKRKVTQSTLTPNTSSFVESTPVKKKKKKTTPIKPTKPNVDKEEESEESKTPKKKAIEVEMDTSDDAQEELKAKKN